MANRIQIGTLVSAHVGPYEPSPSPQGGPLRARIQGKVLASVGPGEWVVEWSNGLIARQQAKSMRIESPPTTNGSSKNPVSGAAAPTEVVDNGNQGGNSCPAEAGPSAPSGSAAAPVAGSAPSGALCAVGSLRSGSTSVPSSGGSTAPPTIFTVVPSSATSISTGSLGVDDLGVGDQDELYYGSDNDEGIPIEEDFRAEQAACVKRLAASCLPGSTVVGDSWFGSVKVCMCRLCLLLADADADADASLLVMMTDARVYRQPSP